MKIRHALGGMVITAVVGCGTSVSPSLSTPRQGESAVEHNNFPPTDSGGVTETTLVSLKLPGMT